MQWLAFIAIGLISLALIALIWTVSSRAIEDEATELRARTDQHLRSAAFVLARQLGDELRMVDQSLTIIQENWKSDSESVDLGAWRKKLLALTAVSDDIFVANEKGIIVQGTLPQSVGQGFGSAYVAYPNGSLELFEANGTKAPDGRTAGGPDKIESRQFLTYIVRPLAAPRGWMLGASYRSENIIKLFSGASLGQNGIVGLVAVARGGLQAIVGSASQFGEMDLSGSDLIEQIRKNDAGIWAGVTPIDQVARIVAYRNVPGRDMSVMVGVSADIAYRPLAGLAAMTRALASLGSLVVLVIAGIVVRTIAATREMKQRQRIHERTVQDLANANQELAVARARAFLSEPEVGTLMSSDTDGVARLDAEQRLRQWNPRFAELAGVPLDTLVAGMPVEDLLRRQGALGLFGDEAEAEHEIAKRLTILHTAGQSVVPPTQLGPAGEQVTMHVRGVSDGGRMIVLAGPGNARLAALPSLPTENEPETADEATEW